MVSTSFGYFIFFQEINDLHYINKIKNIYVHIMASSRYISRGLNSTDNQLEKIIRASQTKQGAVVRIPKDNLSGNFHKIPLTKPQINRITKAKNGLNISLSLSQLKYLKKSGGLLPLLALLPLIFAGLGAAGGVPGGVTSAVTSAKNASAAAA